MNQIAQAGSKKVWLPFLIVGAVLLIDQCLKIWVKTTMCYGQEHLLFGSERARLHFVENPGMAFGLSWGGEWGKYALSIFRIIAIGFLIYLLRRFINQRLSTGILVAFSMVLAGAMGNMIDSAVYGLIFEASNYHCMAPAIMFPPEGGYAGFLQGKVVDMFYFPLISSTFPSWVPLYGGQPFEFFRPVFNVADSSISLGVLYLLLFERPFLSGAEDHAEKDKVAEPATLSTDETGAEKNDRSSDIDNLLT